ncbi:MAG: DNA polymerase/3'-5' exonuclease PolX, partial [Cytophagia bacterium]|nr:DNA polymerase/3'-5' exonuclease PolX [Cytophagia bacterium]
MELHDENSFKIRGYQNAVFQLDKSDMELASLSLSELEGLQGVGKGIAATIREIIQNGTSSGLTDLLESTPEGIVELLDMKGIGPKKIKVLWKELGIESGHELKEAANSGLV